MEWTDELKQEVVEQYTAAKPTPETSTEIVKEIADGLDDATVNGVRAILVKAEVYIKKTPSASKAKDKGTSTRVNKAEAIQGLKDLISNNNIEVSDEILDKMTGKAAVYFTDVLKAFSETE